MAAYTINAIKRGTKIPRVTTVNAQEDTYTLNCGPGAAGPGQPFGPGMPGGRAVIQILPLAFGVLYHSVAGQTATDGFLIPAGQAFNMTLNSGDSFYLGGTGAGTVDIVVIGN